MRCTLLLLASILLVTSTYAQRDTIVYYKKHVPQVISEGADYQVVIQRKTDNSSIMMKCSFEDGQWKVNSTEFIKLKKDNVYTITNGSKKYKRKFKVIPGGYQVEDYNHKGQLKAKGISTTLFPLTCHGQWLNYTDGRITGVNAYKNGVMTRSYISNNKKELLPTNTYVNADELAEYNGGDEQFDVDLSKNITYPVICQENGITGKVFVLFAISESGEPCEFQMLEGNDIYLYQAAVQALASCKKWKPAQKNGISIKVYTVIPINFDLR